MGTAGSSRDLVREDRDEQLRSDAYLQLRGLLLGPEQEQLEQIRKRLDVPDIRAHELSQVVAEAIALRVHRDHGLQHVLNPVVEEALRISVARNPRLLADTLFPIIGRAVRRSVAQALRGIVESLNELLERSLSLESIKWRFESLRTGKPFAEILLARSLRYRVEEAFLIHRETGLLLNHASRNKDPDQSSQLVSAMLTAVQDFVHDSFTETADRELETIAMGEFNLWILHGPDALLAAVVSGVPPPELRMKLQITLERIQEDFGALISSFDGDVVATDRLQPLIESCLVGKQSTSPKPRASRRWLLIAIPVLIMMLVGGGYWLRQRYRWNSAVRLLRAEPGIVLASEETGWRSYRVNGLRDPLSREPSDIIQQSGINPRKVNSRWEPYVSLDPKFDEQRKFEEAKGQVERQLIRFPVNSSHLDADQAVKLDDLEIALQQLQQHGSAIGRLVVVEIAGHTDPSGTEHGNELLSEKRAEIVQKALLDRGVSPALVTTKGLASTAPAQGQSGSYLSELNRRVTFRVLIRDGKRP